ncbi:MAG: hypothetical protein V5A62_02480 [Haloarculaceae archaeon]
MTDRGSGPDGDGEPRDEDLTALVEELSATLESLQEAVRADTRDRPVSPRRPRTPPGPTPPSPRELLRFTEQYTIPTLIALLESGVRSLELLRATLRLLDGRGIETASPATRERVESVGRTTLERVDAVLSDIGSAVEGGDPSDPAARDLLSDARALREEIDRRLREAEGRVEDGDRDGDDGRDWGGTARLTSGHPPAEGRNIPVRSADGSETGGEVEDDDEDVPVDVDAELESIREDVAREEGGTSPVRDSDTDSDPGDGDGGEDRTE